MTTPAQSLIRWPERYLPERSAVFVRNQIETSASPASVWSWLVRADGWPDWYPNSADMHFLSHTGPDLRDRSRFRWRTFGVRITSKVLEFEPSSRIAWDAHGIGVNGYHAWILTPTADGGTHIVTEETQNGWLARLGKRLFPTRMHARHQLWLEALAAKAEGGPAA